MIAESVGYTWGTNFQNVFKRVVGATQEECRKKTSNQRVDKREKK